MTVRTLTYTESVNLVTEECCSCHVMFAMPESMYKKAREDEEKWFYCPNGHMQHYSQSELSKLKSKLSETERQLLQKQREVEQANSARDSFRASAERERKSRERVEKRVANGVCPCCNRHFKNLERHMHTKHPEQVESHAGELPQ